MGKGAHIFIKHGVHAHHGIDCGDGTVVHYPGKSQGGKVSKDRISKFAQGKKIYEIKYKYKECLSLDTTIERAQSRLEQNAENYHLFKSNCEHFAHWCKTGKCESHQVGGVLAPLASGSTAAIATVLLGAVTLAAPFAVGSALTAATIYGFNRLKEEQLEEYDPELLQRIEESCKATKINADDALDLLRSISTKRLSLLDAYRKLNILLTKNTAN